MEDVLSELARVTKERDHWRTAAKTNARRHRIGAVAVGSSILTCLVLQVWILTTINESKMADCTRPTGADLSFSPARIYRTEGDLGPIVNLLDEVISKLEDLERERDESARLLENMWEATAGDPRGLFMHYGVAEESIHSLVEKIERKLR